MDDKLSRKVIIAYIYSYISSVLDTEKMDWQAFYCFVLVCCVAYHVQASHDKELPTVGVQFKHVGYMTAASSHFVNTIRLNPIPRADMLQRPMAYLDQKYMTCDLTFDSFTKYLSSEVQEHFCNRTAYWRNLLRGRIQNLDDQMNQAHTEWNTLFPSRRIATEVNSRKPRFIEFITGAASLISGLLDGYEKFVMAKQIKFLSQNQHDLYENQNRLLTYVQGTQDLNNRRFLNMQQHLARQCNIITEIWAEIRQTR